MSEDREKLLDKIKKLKIKGEGVGTTEAEAQTFLAKAAALMAEHRITEKEVEEAGIEPVAVPKRGCHLSPDKQHPACFALLAIARLTGTYIGVQETIYEAKGKRKRTVCGLVITGAKHDREVADYLFDQVRNVVDAAWGTELTRRLDLMRHALDQAGLTKAQIDDLLADPEGKRAMRRHRIGIQSRERRSFQLGMALRIAERIMAMATRGAETDRALVIWQEQTEVQPPGEMKPNLDETAFARGQITGNDAALGSGVGAGQKEVMKIGSGS